MRSAFFFFFCLQMVVQSPLYAQSSGGGEYRFPQTSCVSPEQYARIAEQLEQSVQELEQRQLLPKAQSATSVLFDFPLRQAAGYSYNSFYGISNYFDHNTGYPNLVTDYDCGTRSYDTQTGYNHQGIDYFLWPFDNLMMSRGQVEVIAAEAGTILLKSDGNPDQSCAFCTGCNWNAVYLLHADGSVTWYGHLKTNSLTAKAVGETVAKGEYLGLVGSSGNSSGPHLHFEVYKALPVNNGNLIDPYAGPCNNRNTQSWWVNQRPYRNPTINHIQTQTAPTSFNTCPADETTYEGNQFIPGQMVYFTSYFSDQVINSTVTYTITRPDQSVFQTWSMTFTNTFNASFWWRSFMIPAGAPLGTWNFRAVYNGQTVNYPFTVSTTTSVSQPQLASVSVRLYPNPVSNELNLASAQWIKQPSIVISNIHGQTVYHQVYATPSKTFLMYLSHLPKGSYTLVLMDGTQKIAERKFVK